MQIRLFLFFLLISLTGVGQHVSSPVSIYVKQGNDSISVNNNSISLKKAPFTLIFRFNQPEKYDGIFVNTSFSKDYFDLNEGENIKDLKYLPQKVYSEYKFNPKKELKVNDEFFQFFRYKETAKWHKFDRIIKMEKKVIAYREVTNFYVVDDRKKITVSDMRKNTYLTFVVIQKSVNDNTIKEVYRIKLKLKF